MAVGLVLSIVALFTVPSLKPFVQSSLKSMGLNGLTAGQHDALDRKTLNNLTIVLSSGNIDEANKILLATPDVLQSISQEVADTQMFNRNSSDEDNIRYAEQLEFIFEFKLLNENTRNTTKERTSVDIDSITITDVTKPLNGWLKHSLKINSLSLAQERLLAIAVKLKAIGSPLDTGAFGMDYFVSRYAQEKEKYSKHRLFTKGLLQASWLKQSVLNGSVDNIKNEFEPMREELNSDSALIRLINNKKASTVMISTQLLGLYLPDNAISALRFQLLRADDEDTKIVLLDTLSLYGTQARSATKQLKQLLRMTQSNLIRKKISETLNRLAGKSKNEDA